jgi:hypothetical protein
LLEQCSVIGFTALRKPARELPRFETDLAVCQPESTLLRANAIADDATDCDTTGQWFLPSLRPDRESDDFLVTERD